MTFCLEPKRTGALLEVTSISVGSDAKSHEGGAAVGVPKADLPVAAGAEEFAARSEGESEHAVGKFAVRGGGTERRVGVGLRDGRPAVIGVPPDEKTVVAAAGEHMTVAPPREGSHRSLVLGEREQNAAARGVPKVDTARAIGSREFFSVGTESGLNFKRLRYHKFVKLFQLFGR